MKKTVYVLITGALLGGAACSRIDANTANTVPTTDAYQATVTSSHAGAGAVESTSADAYVTPTTSSTVPATMRFGTRTVTESSFLMEAASSGSMEVQLGKLALERSTNPEVKEFAQMMINHHSKANKELMEVASGMNVTLPTTLMPEHQQLVTKLSMLTGNKFDEEYIDKLEDAHEKDIALFEVVSNGAQTVTVKAYAIRALPVLRVHEQQAEDLEAKLKAKK